MIAFLKSLDRALLWIVIEVFIFVAFLVISWIGGKFISPQKLIWINPLKSKLRKIAEHKYGSLISIFSLALTLCILFSILFIPQPIIHDEFCYLLAGETFASGRITNPTHPFWEHFESFHLINVPTYMSKYPPAQGLSIAFGRWISGEPIVGIWLVFSLSCTALCWMLRGWMDEKWAFLGGLIAATHPRLVTAWGLTFWGGAISMLGGAMVYGAVARLYKKITFRDSLILSFGIIILANSRPFDGLVSLLPILFLIPKWVKENGGVSAIFNTGQWKLISTRLLIPFFILFCFMILGMGYYNKQITGNYLKLPYFEYTQQYDRSRSFIIQSPNPTHPYNHVVFKTLTDYEKDVFDYRRTPIGYLNGILDKLKVYGGFYLGFIYLIPFLIFLITKKDFWEKFAVFVLSVQFFFETFVTFEFNHYFAPSACFIIYAIVQGFRKTKQITFLKPSTMKLISVTLWLSLLARPIMGAILYETKFQFYKSSFVYKRNQHIANLNKLAEKQIVIVRYKDDHLFDQEWVYNAADIDNSKIVWARDMGSEKNEKLLNYFKDRKAWFIQPDVDESLLVPYERVQIPGLMDRVITQEASVDF